MIARNQRISAVLPRVLIAGAALLSGSHLAHADFALKPNDRVVFYGDSITEQRLYTTFAETYVVTRFPKLPVTFVHSGWGGDRVSGGGGGPIDLRLQRDVLAYKPTVMTIMLGMNDAAYRAFDQGIFDTYANGYAHILDTVKKEAPGVRFTLIQPSPYDDVTRSPTFEGGYNSVLRRYSEFVKNTALARNMGTADLNTPVVAMLQKANATDANLAQKIIPDRVHPGPAGHLIMAEALLKAWDAPSVVSDVIIDSTTQKATRTQNTRVSDVRGGTTTISWTQNDEALPFPLDFNNPEMALALKSSDFVEALDRQPLQVTGLTAPRYTLSIDGDEIGDFTREELAQGINLATLPTPMLDQAKDVHKLTIKHNDQHSWRWRNVQVPLQDHNEEVKKATPRLLKALDEEEEDTIEQQRATAQPKPHRFELTASTATPIGANLALRKPYAVSDPNVYGFGIGALTDGAWSGDGHVFATGEIDKFPKTATIDLGAASTVSQVLVVVPPFGSTKTVKVSVSADNENFTEVGSHTFPLASDKRYRFKFAPMSARYVRLTYPDHYPDNVGYSPNFSFTSEVEVYGPAA